MQRVHDTQIAFVVDFPTKENNILFIENHTKDIQADITQIALRMNTRLFTLYI